MPEKLAYLAQFDSQTLTASFFEKLVRMGNGEQHLFIDIENAIVDGEIAFEYDTIDNPISCENYTFKNNVIFRRATLNRGIKFVDSRFVGYVDFDRAIINGELAFAPEFLPDERPMSAEFLSALFANNIKLNGDLDLRFIQSPRVTMQQSNVDGALFLDNARIGELDIKGSYIKGLLQMIGIQVMSLDLRQARVDSHVLMRGFHSGVSWLTSGKFGVINARGLTTQGQIDFRDTIIRHEADFADARVRLDILLMGARFQPSKNTQPQEADGEPPAITLGLISTEVGGILNLTNATISKIDARSSEIKKLAFQLHRDRKPTWRAGIV